MFLCMKGVWVRILLCSLKSYKTQKDYPFTFKTTLYTNESPDNTGHRPPLHIHTTMLYVPFSPLVLWKYSVQCSCKCIHNRIDNSVHTVRWHGLPFALFWGGFPSDIPPPSHQPCQNTLTPNYPNICGILLPGKWNSVQPSSPGK